MSYPAYPDFGKSTRDFFTKGFRVGSLNLNIRDQVSKNIHTTLTGSHDLEKKEATGDFQAKCTCPVMEGLTSTTKWTTDNVLSQELESNDLLAKGLDLGLEGTWTVESNDLGGKLMAGFRHPRFTFKTAFEGGSGENNPAVEANIVGGYGDFAGGYQGQVDTNEGDLKKSNLALAYVKGPVSFLSSLDNAQVLWAGVVYRHSPTFEVGFNVNYKSEDAKSPEGGEDQSGTVGGVVVKYVIDCCTAIKTKFNSDLLLGVGFETKITPAAALTLSAEIDTNKLNEGGHKVGFSMDFEIP